MHYEEFVDRIFNSNWNSTEINFKQNTHQQYKNEFLHRIWL